MTVMRNLILLVLVLEDFWRTNPSDIAFVTCLQILQREWFFVHLFLHSTNFLLGWHIGVLAVLVARQVKMNWVKESLNTANNC